MPPSEAPAPAHRVPTCLLFAISPHTPLPGSGSVVLQQALGYLWFWAPAPSRHVEGSSYPSAPALHASVWVQAPASNRGRLCWPRSSEQIPPTGSLGGWVAPEDRSGGPRAFQMPSSPSPSGLAATPHSAVSTLETSALLPGLQGTMGSAPM